MLLLELESGVERLVFRLFSLATRNALFHELSARLGPNLPTGMNSLSLSWLQDMKKCSNFT